VKIGELKTDIGTVENLELSIGRVVEETWEEEGVNIQVAPRR
jgi:hypothetical protein